MRTQLAELLRLGKIPDDDKLSDTLFQKYENLFSGFASPVTWEEAELLVTLFSEENLDFNWNLDWGLLHLIETVPLRNTPEAIQKYETLIARCSNTEFQSIMKTRLANWIRCQHE